MVERGSTTAAVASLCHAGIRFVVIAEVVLISSAFLAPLFRKINPANRTL
jgi:hypothetical protein